MFRPNKLINFTPFTCLKTQYCEKYWNYRQLSDLAGSTGESSPKGTKMDGPQGKQSCKNLWGAVAHVTNGDSRLSHRVDWSTWCSVLPMLWQFSIMGNSKSTQVKKKLYLKVFSAEWYFSEKINERAKNFY